MTSEPTTKTTTAATGHRRLEDDDLRLTIETDDPKRSRP
jgi:hypothetical protein